VAERCVVLLKGQHQYVFRVEAGQEARFLEALERLAENDRLNFDWEDVAFFRSLMADLTASTAAIGRQHGDEPQAEGGP